MSDKAFRQFVTEVRAACDRYLAACVEVPPLKRVTKDNVHEHPHFKKPARPKGNPICRCGHMLSVHEEPSDDAKGNPKNICRGCDADGSKIGCPEFVSKRKLPGATNGAHVSDGAVEEFSAIERAILAALKANSHQGWTAQQISILTVYTRSGDFNAAVANLRALGLVERGAVMTLSAEGRKAAVDIGASYDAESLRAAWAAKLKKEMPKRIIERLTLFGPMTAAMLAEKCGYTRSGDFNAALAKMRRVGLITRKNPMSLCPELL